MHAIASTAESVIHLSYIDYSNRCVMKNAFRIIGPLYVMVKHRSPVDS